LFGLLDASRKQPVIWVSGPPGSGKTTLVASYLDAHRLPCLWYQIDPGDADPATFFYYLGLAAKSAAPQKRKPLPLLTPEYQQGIPTFTLRYFEELHNRLHPPKRRSNPPSPPFDKGGIKGEFVVVFDNYQEIPTNSRFHEVMLNGLSIIPEGINVIIISRSDPPSTLIRLRANHQMEVLGWDELRLTLQESEGIVRQRSREKQTREAISLLHKAADGWAAGLILMLESVKRKVFEPQALGKLTPEEIIDYFGNELFDKTDRETQDFLLKTAFLPKMTAKMAEDLTGLSHASRILNALSRTHYFTEKRFHGESIYQYHPLFRDFLISRAKETFSLETRSILIHGAATLLEEAGQTEAAIVLLKDVSDWDMMIRIILKHAPLMVAQGRYHPLEEWVRCIPKDITENNPWLLYWRGTSCLPSNPSQSRPYFEKAFEKFRKQEDKAGMFLAWAGIVSSITAGFENFQSLDRWISILEELMQAGQEFPSEEIGLRVASSMFSALRLRQPQHPQIEAWAERALSLAESCSAINPQIQTLSSLVNYRIRMGDYRKAALAMNSLQKLALSQDQDPLSLIMAKLAEAAYYQTAGNHEKCLKAVYTGLDLSSKAGIHLYEHFLLGQGILSALSSSDSATAEKLLEKMGTPATSLKPWMACFYHHLRTHEALFQEDLKRAFLHADLALKYCEDTGVLFSRVLCQLERAHVLHGLGKEGEAAADLREALELARQIKSRSWEYYGLMAEALFALDRGEEPECLAILRRALPMGKEGGYLETFIDRPSALARLCQKALEAGIELEQVQRIIRRRNLMPEKAPLHLENWPWPIKIYTLGRFELQRDGRPIRFSRKAQQKPLSMLKALIAFGGKEVREDQIEDALWPEADGDIAYQSFKITLHRLRQLLGYEKAIQRQEGRLTLDPRYCWVDVWAFEQILEEADARSKEGKKEVANGLIEKATEMYRGSFLGREIEQPWATSLRERLREKFLRNVGRLGLYWQQAGQWEKALDGYHKGLEIDNLAEEFYQGLMTCYHHLGRRPEALGVYQRCKRNLSSALGIEPSAKTEAIHHKILSEKR
jgi:ATP/maltotriose-dependent transcriptional regulator MalT/DNA-binding SARP family transcriptional activator